MKRPYSLDLADAASSQFSSTIDGLTGTTQSDNALVSGSIGLASSLFAGRLGELDTLTLSLATRLVIVTGHLQGQLQ